jgi:hypothetical protein
VGQNPPFGAQIYYSLTNKADNVTLKVLDIDGKTVREFRSDAKGELKGAGNPGLHRVAWDMTRLTGMGPAGGGGGGKGGKGGGKGGFGGKGGGPGGFAPRVFVAPGDYRVVLSVDGQEFTQSLRIQPDPNVPAIIAAAEVAVEEEEAGLEARPIDR